MNQKAIDALAKGETVSFRPHGNSMLPYIKSGQLVTVEPAAQVEEGDIVFCRVKGVNYVHMVKRVKDGLAMICNAVGKENGWASKIYGKVVVVED